MAIPGKPPDEPPPPISDRIHLVDDVLRACAGVVHENLRGRAAHRDLRRERKPPPTRYAAGRGACWNSLIGGAGFYRGDEAANAAREEGDCWYLDSGEKETRLLCTPFLMQSREALVPSPDASFLAVQKSGEGHGWIEMLDLD